MNERGKQRRPGPLPRNDEFRASGDFNYIPGMSFAFQALPVPNFTLRMGIVMADIFLSYKREDLERIVPLVRALERQGYTVWWDSKIVASEDWQRCIVRELHACSCVVVAWSRNSVDQDRLYTSDHIFNESGFGHKRLILVPALLDPGRIAWDQPRTHYADLTGWVDDEKHKGLRELVAAVGKLVGSRNPPAADELEAWQAAEAEHTPDAFRAFLARFPQSKFAPIADSRVAAFAHAEIAPSFFIEDDVELQSIYNKERLLRYPLPSSTRQIGYVDIPELNGYAPGRMLVRRRESVWRLPDDLRLATDVSFQEWMRFAERRKVHDGRNARSAGIEVRRDLRLRRVPTLTVEELRYEDYLRSNLVLDHCVGGRKSLRQTLHGDGRLEPFSRSRLANIIGINILVVNPIGDVPLQVRSGGVAVRPHQVCASASGTFEIDDVGHGAARLSQCNLLRELGEELGVKLRAKVTSTVVVGLARELARGGQLEISVVAEANFSREDVEAAVKTALDRKEWLQIDYLRLDRSGNKYKASQLEKAIAELEQKYPGKVSAPLRANLSLWFRHLSAEGSLA